LSTTQAQQKRRLQAAERKAAELAARAGTTQQKIPISAGGLESVKGELESLRKVKRPTTVGAVSRAREEGDLRENAGYHAAREELGMIDGRIKELESIIKNSVVTEMTTDDSDVIRVGSTVVLALGGEEVTYTIVGAQEAKPREGKISNVSPVGSALLGHAVGDDFEITTPGTSLRAIVREVRSSSGSSGNG